MNFGMICDVCSKPQQNAVRFCSSMVKRSLFVQIVLVFAKR